MIDINLGGDFLVAAKDGGVVSAAKLPADLSEGAPYLLSDEVNSNMAGQGCQLVPLLAFKCLWLKFEVFGHGVDDG